MADDIEEVVVGDVWVLAHGEAIGLVKVHPAHEADVKRALEAAGYTLQPGVAAPDGTIDAVQACAVENPRPCEVNITLGRIEELAQAAGGDPAPIAALEAQRYFTEAEAEAAIARTIASMPPGEARDEAELWRAVAFGEGPDAEGS